MDKKGYMNKIKSKLNSLGRRLLVQASYIQHLADRGLLDHQDSSQLGWMDPVRLPPESDVGLFGLGDSPVSDAKSRDTEKLSAPSGPRRTPVLLVTDFLKDWFEWKVLSGRWVRFFGVESQNSLPYRFDFEDVEVVEILVDKLAKTENYLKAYRDSLLPESGLERGTDEGNLVLSMAQFGEHDRLVRGLLRYAEQHEAPSETLSLSLRNLEDLSEEIIERVRTLPRQSKTSARRLRAYRYSTLSLSWLLNAEDSNGETGDANSSLVSRVYQAIDETNGIGDNIRKRVSNVPVPNVPHVVEAKNARVVMATLPRILRTIGEIGLSRFVEVITDDDFQGGTETPVSIPSVQVLTSRQDADSVELRNASMCIALAISDEFHPDLPVRDGNSQSENAKGESESRSSVDDRRSTFDQTLRHVRWWLARYGSRETALLIITDLWNTGQFAKKHSRVLQAWRDRGVSIVVAVPNPNGTNLSFIDTGLR